MIIIYVEPLNCRFSSRHGHKVEPLNRLFSARHGHKVEPLNRRFSSRHGHEVEPLNCRFKMEVGGHRTRGRPKLKWCEAIRKYMKEKQVGA